MLFAADAVLASPITIQNSSFEVANLAIAGNGIYSQLISPTTIGGGAVGGTLPNWTAASSTVNAAAGGFDYTPSGINWTIPWENGNNVAYLQMSSAGTVSLSQILSDSLLNDSAYTLTSLIGRRGFTPNFNYSLQLFAGNTLLSSAGSLSLVGASSGTETVLYSSGANNPLAGQALQIRFTTTGIAGTVTEAFFDDVKLDVVTNSLPPAPGVPEPSTLALLGSGIVAAVAKRVRRRGRAIQ